MCEAENLPDLRLIERVSGEFHPGKMPLFTGWQDSRLHCAEVHTSMT